MHRLLLAAAIAAVTFQARADVVSQMQFQPDWSNLETLSFQKFDPTLGTLLSVQVSASADVGSVLTFTADVSGTWFVWVEEDLRLGLTSGLNYLVFESSGQSAMAGTQINAVENVPWPMSISNEFVTTTNLDAYTGNDNWTTTVQGGSFIYLEDNASFSQGSQELKNLSVSVEYTYTPAVVVTPEPHSAGLTLIGLTLFGLGFIWRTKLMRLGSPTWAMLMSGTRIGVSRRFRNSSLLPPNAL